MKLKDIFELITDCYINIHKINPESKYDPFVLYDIWFNNDDDLKTILRIYGEFPVVNITCYDDGPTVVITIDNP